MRSVFQLSLGISFLLFISVACAPTDREQVTAFTHVTLVPMTVEEVIEDQTVLVEGGRITQIGSFEEVTIPEHGTIIDGGGAFLLPGLADMHTHIHLPWLNGQTPTLELPPGRQYPVSPLNLYLANGVTTIRSFGSGDITVDYVLRMRDEIEAGERAGPTIYATGAIIDGSNSYRPTVFVEGDAAKLVRKEAEQGFDFIKPYSYLTEEQYLETMNTAHEIGMYTAGHIPYAIGLDGVLAAGMDEIAHIEQLDWELLDIDRSKALDFQQWPAYLFSVASDRLNSIGYDFDTFTLEIQDTLSQKIAALQAHDIRFSTTVVVSEIITQKLTDPRQFLSQPKLKYMPPSYFAAFQQGQDPHQSIPPELAVFKYELDMMLLRELKRAQIPLVLGTDAGTGTMGLVPGYSVHDELRILTENGFTPYEAIATATVNASQAVEEMVGVNDFGAIEVGKRADLILLSSNPLEDVANIRNPLGVMAAGRWYSQETLAGMMAVEN